MKNQDELTLEYVEKTLLTWQTLAKTLFDVEQKLPLNPQGVSTVTVQKASLTGCLTNQYKLGDTHSKF